MHNSVSFEALKQPNVMTRFVSRLFEDLFASAYLNVQKTYSEPLKTERFYNKRMLLANDISHSYLSWCIQTSYLMGFCLNFKLLFVKFIKMMNSFALRLNLKEHHHSSFEYIYCLIMSGHFQ